MKLPLMELEGQSGLLSRILIVRAGRSQTMANPDAKATTG